MLHKGIKTQLAGIVLLLSAIFTHMVTLGEGSLLALTLFFIGIIVFVIGFFVN